MRFETKGLLSTLLWLDSTRASLLRLSPFGHCLDVRMSGAGSGAGLLGLAGRRNPLWRPRHVLGVGASDRCFVAGVSGVVSRLALDWGYSGRCSEGLISRSTLRRRPGASSKGGLVSSCRGPREDSADGRCWDHSGLRYSWLLAVSVRLRGVPFVSRISCCSSRVELNALIASPISGLLSAKGPPVVRQSAARPC